MRRATIIATCLVNSGMIPRLEDAERRVHEVFASQFPDDDFAVWNRDVGEIAAAHIISTVGRASRINVRSFIDDLRSA